MSSEVSIPLISRPPTLGLTQIYEEALRASPNDPAVLCSYADYLTYQANDAQRASKVRD